MKITKIQQQQNKDRYSIFIDEKFAFGIDDIDLINYKLIEGLQITEARYEEIYNNVLLVKAKNKAYSFLSFKMRTKKEVEDKLKEDYSDDIVLNVISILEHYSYIDDYKYALLYTKDKFNFKKYGLLRIKYELKNRGINEVLINEVFEYLDLDEISILLDLIYKKTKGNKITEYKEKKRLFDFLIRRGFDYTTINEAYKIFME